MGRSSQARDLLVNSSLALMYEKSYTTVGVQEICADAGVNKGSFYHFFPSKRALTLAALESLWSGYRTTFLDPTFSTRHEPIDRIRRFFDAHYRHQRQVKREGGRVLGCPFGNLSLEMATLDETLRGAIQNYLDQMEGYLEAALQEARRTHPGLDSAAGARCLLATYQGAMVLAKTRNRPEVLRDLRDRVRDLVGGLGFS